MKRREKYKHFAVVRPSGTFPIDMLRYERCWPSEEAESFKIERVNRREDIYGPPMDGDRRIEVAKTSGDKTACWEEGRWRSFNCEILETRTERA